MKTGIKNLFSISFVALFTLSLCCTALLYVFDENNILPIKKFIIDIDILNSLSVIISYLSLVMSIVFEVITRKTASSFSSSKFVWLIMMFLIFHFVIRLVIIEKNGSNPENFAKAQIAMSLILNFFGMNTIRSIWDQSGDGTKDQS